MTGRSPRSAPPAPRENRYAVVWADTCRWNVRLTDGGTAGFPFHGNAEQSLEDVLSYVKERADDFEII